MLDQRTIADVINTPGAVIVMPTDTLYGLVAKAVDASAVNRLYRLKQRDAKPGTLIAKDIDQLVNLGFTRRYLKAVEQFWPGAVSVVIPLGHSFGRNYLSLGLDSLAVRIPDDAIVTKVLSLTGPLMTTSANLPGQPPATNIDSAKEYFNGKVDAYFDGGDYSDRLPSTLIKVVDDAVVVLRNGAVDIPK